MEEILAIRQKHEQLKEKAAKDTFEARIREVIIHINCGITEMCLVSRLAFQNQDEVGKINNHFIQEGSKYRAYVHYVSDPSQCRFSRYRSSDKTDGFMYVLPISPDAEKEVLGFCSNPNCRVDYHPKDNQQ
jgi:hypothetical protein